VEKIFSLTGVGAFHQVHQTIKKDATRRSRLFKIPVT